MNLAGSFLVLLGAVPQSLAPQAPSAPAPHAPAQHAPAPAASPSSEPLVEAAIEAPIEPPIEPYRGSLAEGLAEIERLSDAGSTDEALAVVDALVAPTSFLRWRARAVLQAGWKQRAVEAADPLFDLVGLHALPREHRAAVEYARGVVLARAERRAESEAAFGAAREGAGPGDLRLDAIYNLGTSAVFEGEAERAKIPEVQGSPPQAQPPMPAGPAGPGGPGGTGPSAAPPDPLALARAAYLRAREHFIERVKADWRDEDVRANLELVQRRLKELDEIEKKREEQKKEEEKKDQDQKNQDQKDQKQDPKDQDQKDKQQQDEPKPDPDGKDQPKPEEKKPEEQKPEPKDEEKPKPDESQPEERMTKEEMTQLLDRLKELEEQARRMQEQVQRARRVKVKKDW